MEDEGTWLEELILVSVPLACSSDMVRVLLWFSSGTRVHCGERR